MRAAMVVPMVAGGPRDRRASASSPRSPGAPSPRPTSSSPRSSAAAPGTAVENARLYAERSHIAATLQRGLLPDELPAIEGLRLASLYRPAGEENLVGGDFYDAFPTPAGWMLLVGDVTGRGAEAAALTGQARHTLRTAGALLGDPDAALEQLNLALAQRDGADAVHGRARARRPRTRGPRDVRCAGHPQPLLVRDGEVAPVGHFGPMLGAWSDSHWRADESPCAPATCSCSTATA